MKGDWLGKVRRQRRVLARVRRAAWRLEQAERERAWALVAARVEGVSVRKAAEAAGLSPSRVHQLTKDADLDALDVVLGELRAAGWPAPEDLEGSDDEELSGRASVAERLVDEVGWIRQCADWVDHLDRESYPPAANLRSEADFPDRANVVVDSARVSAILRRIAFDVDELARARSVEDLAGARVGDDPRAERRRRLAEPDLEYAEFTRRKNLPWRSTRQGEAAWDAYQAERHHRGETDQDPYTVYNPFRPGRA
ncbi:hypothetical protein [Streptomyces bikiniensis]|uniref:hypothetical protein n=1 Tax=Streptomyces bikiniensis TaxID=1896 RepID=UPI00131A4BE8|nr:hypothetical protein [Streptomyces bikiniensis]